MKEIEFTTPWPPSVNQLYPSSRTPTYSTKTGKIYHKRYLSKKGYQFKKHISELLNYVFPHVRYGDHPIEVKVIYNSPTDNRIRDVHNIEKILFDSFEDAGIINNDKQVVQWLFKPGNKIKNGSLDIMIKPYICLDSQNQNQYA